MSVASRSPLRSSVPRLPSMVDGASSTVSATTPALARVAPSPPRPTTLGAASGSAPSKLARFANGSPAWAPGPVATV